MELGTRARGCPGVPTTHGVPLCQELAGGILLGYTEILGNAKHV